MTETNVLDYNVEKDEALKIDNDIISENDEEKKDIPLASKQNETNNKTTQGEIKSNQRKSDHELLEETLNEGMGQVLNENTKPEDQCNEPKTSNEANNPKPENNKIGKEKVEEIGPEPKNESMQDPAIVTESKIKSTQNPENDKKIENNEPPDEADDLLDEVLNDGIGNQISKKQGAGEQP